MNRLSEYITGMKLTRQLLTEARIRANEGKEMAAIRYLIDAFDAYVKSMNCVISIKDGKRPRGAK